MKFAKVFHIEEGGQDVLFYIDEHDEDKEKFCLRIVSWFQEVTKVTLAVGPFTLENAKAALHKVDKNHAYDVLIAMYEQLPERLR